MRQGYRKEKSKGMGNGKVKRERSIAEWSIISLKSDDFEEISAILPGAEISVWVGNLEKKVAT